MKKVRSHITLLLLFISAVPSIAQIQFIPNKGQWQGPFDFKANIQQSYTAFFEKHAVTFLLSDYSEVENGIHKSDAVVINSISDLKELGAKKLAAENRDYNVRNHAYKMEFLHSNTIGIVGEGALSYYQNYFLGNDNSKWKGHVSVFSGLKYQQIYPGIDLTYRTEKNNLKYEFTVAPHAEPKSIQMQYSGVDVSISDNGNLTIKTSLGNMTEYAPYCYQIINNKKTQVRARFELKDNIVSIGFPETYNTSYELIIDPEVEYQTYTGATQEALAYGSTYGADKKMYSLCMSPNDSWPVTLGAFQTSWHGGQEIALNVFTPDGSGLVYSTYIGGSKWEVPSSVSVNSRNEAVIVGWSESTDFPVTTGCLQPLNKGIIDGVAVVLSADGSSMISGSYYGSKGNNDDIRDVVWSSDNDFYLYGALGGNTTTANKIGVDMPANAYKPNNTGKYGSFVLKLNKAQTQVLAGTYIGNSPSGKYTPKILRLDEYTGEILIGGYATGNANYPVTANAYQQPNVNADWYGTISKFDANLTTLKASSCLYREVQGIDTDPEGNIYAIGICSPGSVTASPGVYAENDFWSATFLVKMNADLTTASLSTNLPINGYLNVEPYSFERSNCGHFYIYYPTTATNISFSPAYAGPFISGALTGGGSNELHGYYFMEIDKNFQSLLFSAWMGGTNIHSHGGTQDIDPEGRIYANQCHYSFFFPPGTAGSWSPNTQLTGAGYDVTTEVVNMEVVHDTIKGNISVLPDTVVCIGTAFQLNGNMSGPIDSYSWNFGDGSPEETANPAPTHTYAASGIYNILLKAENTEGCDFIDTISNAITVAVLDPEPISVSPQDTAVCNSDALQITVTGGATFEWMPPELVDNPTGPIVTINNPGETNLTVTVTDNHKCLHTQNVHVEKYNAHAEAGPDKIIVTRRKESVMLDGAASSGTSVYWDADPSLSSTTSLTPIASPQQTRWYYINAEDHTCNSRDSAKVTVVGFGVPNAFSPNGDGLNDQFYAITNYGGFVVNVSIFNRFGELVFHTEKNEGWDGTFKGKPCDMGTYYYSATIYIEEEKYDLKGDITLIR